MRTKIRMSAFGVMVAFASLAPTAPAEAQLANASAPNLGMGGNTTATARGFGAIAANPAGLGMPGAGFSMAVAPVSLRQGLGPVTLGNILDFEGVLIPAETKAEWLSRVAAQGRQNGSAGAEASAVAFTRGRFGFQLSTVAGTRMTLAPDMVEAILYGNAGRTGEPADLAFADSRVDGFGVTTAGFSLGVPLSLEDGAMAVGVTLKYSMGHGVLVGRDEGGVFGSDPVRVDFTFPTIMPDEDGSSWNSGSGIGMDVGFQLKRERVSFGAAVLNAFNTFSWNLHKLAYLPGTAVMEVGNASIDFDQQPASSAPDAVKRALDEMKFDPTVSLGAAYDVTPDLTVSGDVKNRFGDGMSLAPKLHAGVGAEYRGVKRLSLQAGIAAITEGIQFGGGASLALGGVNLSLAGGVQKGDVRDTSIGQFTLSFGGR